LEIRPTGILEVFERIMRDPSGAPEYHYVLIDYVCRVTGGTLRAGDDVCAVEWVRRRDLPRLPITEGTLGVIERAFSGAGLLACPSPSETRRRKVAPAGSRLVPTLAPPERRAPTRVSARQTKVSAPRRGPS
jgi:hypothetical protein